MRLQERLRIASRPPASQVWSGAYFSAVAVRPLWLRLYRWTKAPGPKSRPAVFSDWSAFQSAKRRSKPDVMNLAGFCRNCWPVVSRRRRSLSRAPLEHSRGRVRMPYKEWKSATDALIPAPRLSVKCVDSPNDPAQRDEQRTREMADADHAHRVISFRRREASIAALRSSKRKIALSAASKIRETVAQNDESGRRITRARHASNLARVTPRRSQSSPNKPARTSRCVVKAALQADPLHVERAKHQGAEQHQERGSWRLAQPGQRGPHDFDDAERGDQRQDLEIARHPGVARKPEVERQRSLMPRSERERDDQKRDRRAAADERRRHARQQQRPITIADRELWRARSAPKSSRSVRPGLDGQQAPEEGPFVAKHPAPLYVSSRVAGG